MIDLRTFTKRTDAVRLGVILYMPNPPNEHEFTGAGAILRKRLDRLPKELAARIADAPSTGFIRMLIQSAAHDTTLNHNPDARPPEWFAALPAPFRREAERERAVHVVEDPNILLGFPYTEIGGYVIDLDERSLFGSAYRLFGLHRLGDIRQLAWLTQPVLPADQPGVIPMRFEHNRLCHVWDTAAVANLIVHGMEFHLSTATTLILAAATHDARTPAGGDTTKLLDREFFDEDKHYPELLEHPDVLAFLREYGIDTQLLKDTILGKGILGSILDLADKTAYLSRDAYWFHYRFRGQLLDCEEGEAVHDLLLHHPDACSAWKHAICVDGRLVLTDPEALARLLRLRALLFRALYFHPGSRFTEFIISHLVIRHLLDSGKVTKEELLTWRDKELDDRVEVFGELGFGENYGEPAHEGFDDLASAEKRRDELRAKGEVCVMIETLPPRIKSGTHFLVSDGYTAPQPLAEAFPELAEPIDALAETVHPFRLYWVPRETIPLRVLDLLSK